MNRTVLSDRELQVLGAWWNLGSVKEAAAWLGITEQTAKNTLRTARLRVGASNTLLLARMFEGQLPNQRTMMRLRRAA